MSSMGKYEIFLSYNPFKEEGPRNSLSYKKEFSSVRYPVEDGALSRVSYFSIDEMLNESDDWKGLFKELFNGFCVTKASFFFTGPLDDYKKIIDTYQNYSSDTSIDEKIELEFFPNTNSAAELTPYSIEQKYCLVTELFDFYDFTLYTLRDNVSENNFQVRFITEWKQIIDGCSDYLLKIRETAKLFKDYKSEFLRLHDRLTDKKNENQEGINILSYEQYEVDIKHEVLEIEKELLNVEKTINSLLNEIESEKIPHVFLSTKNGKTRGWVKAADAVKKYTHFYHEVHQKYEQQLEGICLTFQNILPDDSTIDPLYKIKKREYLSVIQETHCYAKSNKIHSSLSQSEETLEEYIDLLDWQKSYLSIYSRNMKKVMEVWIQQKYESLKKYISDYYKKICLQVSHYEYLLRKKFLAEFIARLDNLLELQAIYIPDISFEELKKIKSNLDLYEKIKEDLVKMDCAISKRSGTGSKL